MPKPKYKISSFLLNNLKHRLETELSYQIITKFDCKKLSHLIFDETNKSVSESTIYRIFLRESFEHAPYTHTLDIFAEFLGYSEWFELEKTLNELTNFQFLSGLFPDERQYKSLITFSIHSGQLKPVYNFLEQFNPDLSFEKKLLLGRQLFYTLRTNPNSNLQFFKNFNSLPIVREGFYEYLADPDFTIPDYDKGILHYLSSVKPHESNKSLQDFIFANSMLLRYYFLKKKKSKVLQLGKLIYLEISLTAKELTELHIYPKIRYLAYRLLYDFMLNGFNQTYWEWLEDFSTNEMNLTVLYEKRMILHTLLDVLQMNPALQEQKMNEFYHQFPAVFTHFPSNFTRLSIKDRLYYLNPNASTFV
jgi:hypothetical protein